MQTKNDFSLNDIDLRFSPGIQTLWAMLQHPAEKVVEIMATLDYVKENAVHHRERGGDWPDSERNRLRLNLLQTVPWLSDLQLPATKGSCSRLADSVLHLGIDAAIEAANGATKVLEDELKGGSVLI